MTIMELWNFILEYPDQIHTVGKSTVRRALHAQCQPGSLPKCYICTARNAKLTGWMSTGFFFGGAGNLGA